MRTNRGYRIALAVVLLLLPSLTPAEVSVRLDGKGAFHRLFYLTRGEGPNRVIWGQVRPGVSLRLMLNPLGDNLGDLAPTLRLSPATGLPWAVWSMNVAGQKRVGFSSWTAAGWLAPTPIVAKPGPYFYNELGPDLAFDQSGRPFVVWWRPESVGRVYLSTLVGGAWTPAVLLSDEAIDSRQPSIAIDGSVATITYQTSSGAQTKTYDTAFLVQSAANLMDTPIPPGQQGGPDTGDPGGGSPDQNIKK
jgi:hypothetical protein